MRVCVLKTTRLLTSHQIISLSFNGTQVPDFFLFTEVSKQMAATEAGDEQWLVGEFNLQGYDPTVDKQSQFLIEVRDAASYDVKLNGGLSIAGQAQPNVKPKSGTSSTTYEVSTFASKVWDKIAVFGDDGFEIALGGLAKNPFAVISGAAGLIKNLTSSGSTPSYSITLQGTQTLDGQITLSPASLRKTISVYVRPDATNNGFAKALNSIPWGVLRYNKAVGVTRVEEFYEQDDGDEDERFAGERVKLGFFNEVLTINPEISGYISKIEAGWIEGNAYSSLSGSNNVDFMLLSDFQSQEHSVCHAKLNAVAIRITFNNGDVIYNRIPTKGVDKEEVRRSGCF